MITETNRDYSKFFTPRHIANFMAGLLDPKAGECILEPSAGDGALVKAVISRCNGSIVFAFETNEAHRQHLKQAGAKIVVIKDFLQIPDYAKFTSCIANPPFGNCIDLRAHFNKICEMVKVGGKVVMIVPKGFDPIISHIEHELENWSSNSDGTTTRIKIIEFINKKL